MQEGVAIFLHSAIDHLRDEARVIARPIGAYEDVALSGPVQSGRGKQELHLMRNCRMRDGDVEVSARTRIVKREHRHNLNQQLRIAMKSYDFDSLNLAA
jgi:hypothetical protein